MKKIVMASDHAGFDLRRHLVDYVRSLGHEVTDLGTHSKESTDYPIYGAKVGHAVAEGEYDCGIVVCGTGVGISLAANTVQGIRALACAEPYTARLSRQHNNANVLGLGARVVGFGLAEMIVDEWLRAEYMGGRHAHRVDQLTQLECGYSLE